MINPIKSFMNAVSTTATPADYIIIPAKAAGSIIMRVVKLIKNAAKFAFHSLMADFSEGNDKKVHQKKAKNSKVDLKAEEKDASKQVKKAKKDISKLADGKKVSKVKKAAQSIGNDAKKTSSTFIGKAVNEIKDFGNEIKDEVDELLG